MGTTSEKLTYLNETKQELKQAINNIGGSITDETTFRQYVDQLGGVYDVLPKTSFQEGTEVTIENGLKGKIDFDTDNGKKIVGYGDTSQNSYEGYNLTNIYSLHDIGFSTTSSGITCTWLEGGKIKVNGTASEDAYISISKDLNVTSGTTYRGSGCPSGGSTSSYILQFLDLSTTYYIDTNSYDTGSGVSFIPFADKTCLIRLLVKSGTTCNNLILEPMITLGSTQKTFEPYVGGIASPNPSYPQDIEVVRGKNRLPLNEADFTTTFYGQNVEIKDEVIKISGSATQIYSISVGKNDLVTPSDTSRITFKVNSGTYKYTQFNSGTSYSGINVRLKDEDTNAMYATGSTITLSETHTFSINIFVADIDSKNAEIKLQLEKGSQATSYLPYNTIEEVVSGKNVLNFVKWLENARAYGQRNGNTGMGGGTLDSYTDNSFTFTASGNDCYSQSFTMNGTASVNKTFCELYPHLVFEVEPSTYYTLSFKRSNETLPARPMFFYLDENYNYLSLADSGSLNISSFARQTPSNCKYMLFRIGLVNNSGASMTISNLQLEKGNTSSDYEPYHTPITYPISLGNNKFYSIGDYADELLYDVENDKVYKKAYIEEIHLTKNINWIGQVFNNVYRVNTDAYTDILLPLSESTSSYVKSNMYIAGWATVFGRLRSGYIGIYTNSNIYICTHFTTSNMQGWKDFLDANDVVVVAPRKEPLLTELTDTTLHQQVKNWYYAKSYNGTTIIESNGDLPMIIKIRALKGE